MLHRIERFRKNNNINILYNHDLDEQQEEQFSDCYQKCFKERKDRTHLSKLCKKYEEQSGEM